VLAELQRISERKIRELSPEAMLAKYASLEKVTIAPFDLETFVEMRNLSPDLELHDRIIAATVRQYGAKLISRDSVLSRTVETIW
jgi:PIN domain nuclease of toxin-antitoxin system